MARRNVALMLVGMAAETLLELFFSFDLIVQFVDDVGVVRFRAFACQLMLALLLT